jgi:hypothetical protein
VLLLLLLAACDETAARRRDAADLSDLGNPAETGLRDQLSLLDSGALDSLAACPSDKLAPFEGGPAYYQQFSAFPASATFFPIAVWLQSPTNADKYKAIGINTFIGLWQGPTGEQLSGLKAQGLRTICDQNATGLANLSEPTIIGWMHDDEPDNAQPDGQGGYGPCVDPKVIQAKYAGWKSKDATRPIYLNLGRGVSDINWVGRGVCTGKTEMYPEYAKGADVLSYDIYPVNDGDNKLWMVADGIDNLRKWASYKKPVWNWIESTPFDGGTAPTPDQVRAEIWMSLVHGSLGIGYFAHIFKPGFIEAGLLADSAMSQAVSAINQQITALAPVLNTPSVEDGVVTSTSNAQVPVHTMVKRSGGATYLFAVAMRPGGTTASFTPTCVQASASVEVLGESRTLSLDGGTFSDSFGDFAVHLYRIGP